MGGGAVGGSTHYACARSGPTPLRRVGAVGGLALSGHRRDCARFHGARSRRVSLGPYPQLGRFGRGLG